MAVNPDNIAASGLDLSGGANEVPDDDEVKTVLNRIKAARESATDPVDLQQFSDAEDKAKQLYKDQADRSEWLSLAEQVGRSLVKYGAAKQGLAKGVNMSNPDLGPSTDWTGRLDRYAKDYGTDLEKINRERQAALKNQGEDYGLAEKAFDTAAKEKATRAAEARAAAAQAASDKRQDKSIEAAGDRQTNQIAFQEGAQDRRMQQQRDFESDREERRLRDADVRDLDSQEKEARKSLTAKQQLFNELSTDSDLGNKARDKLQMQYGKLAADAGVDLDDIQQKLSKEESGLQILGGRSKEEDATAKKKILTDSLLDSRSLLDAIAKRKRDRLKSGARTAAPDSTADDQDSGLVKVKGPSGQVATMTRDKAKKYLDQTGYTLVP